MYKKILIAALVLAGFLFVPALTRAQFDNANVIGFGPDINSTRCLNLTSVNLEFGARDMATGGQVTDLQYFLGENGYLKDSPTGYFGPKTVSAVRKLQKDYDLGQVGRVGPGTRALIRKLTCSTTSTGTSPAESLPWQPATDAKAINLISPNGGQIYLVGSTTVVKWETRNVPASSTVLVIARKENPVKPEFFTERRLASSTNSGSTTVSLAGLGVGNYRIKVSVQVGDQVVHDLSNGQIIIAPSIQALCKKAGDANCDGKVNGADRKLIDNGYKLKLTGWANGDFNGDGIVDASDYTIFDQAIVFETYVPPTFRLTYPNGGESFATTAPLRYTWNSSESVSELTVFVLNENNATVRSLNVSFDSTKGMTSSLNLSSPLPVGKYKLKVCIINTNTCDTSDAYFNLVAPTAQPSITLLSPNGGETYTVGDTVRIKWNSTNIPADKVVSISYIKAGSSIYSGTVTQGYCNNGGCIPVSQGYIDYKIPASIAPGQYKMVIYCWDKNSEGSQCGANDTSDAYFKLVAPTAQPAANPAITVTAPNGQSISTSSPLTVTWTINYTASLYKATIVNSNNVTVVTSPLPVPVQGRGTYEISPAAISNLSPGTYTLNVCDINLLTLCGRTTFTIPAPVSPSPSPSVTPVAAPSIKLIRPNGGEVYPLGTTITVWWESTSIPTSNVVTVLARWDNPARPGFFTEYNLGSAVNTTGAMTAKLSGLNGAGNYRIKVYTYVDGKYIQDISDAQFTVK